MNKIRIVLLTMFLFLPNISMAVPNYIMNNALATTGFTVTITANESGLPERSMNFTGKADNTIVYPIGTNNGIYRWGYIYNTGTTRLSFQMASPTPANIVLKVDAASDMSHSFKVTLTPGHPSGSNWNGWRYVLPGRSANIFAIATFNSKATKQFNIPVKVTG